MSRHARVKAHNTSRYYHCMNRIAGPKDWYPFGDLEKEQLVRIFKKYTALYTIEIISYCIMGNHWHVCLWVSGKRLSQEQACDRYNRFYKKTKKPLTIEDKERCETVRERLRDISKFLADVQVEYTRWYNNSNNRRGSLWGDRFKSVILEGTTALWNVIKYIELNPVRAGIVDDPADYRFSSWGVWIGSGKHPFASNFHKHAHRSFGQKAESWNIHELENKLRADMAATIAREHGADGIETGEIYEYSPDNTPSIKLQFLRHCRYYNDSLILGSKFFIDSVMEDIGNKAIQTKRELQHSFDRVISGTIEINVFHHLNHHVYDKPKRKSGQSPDTVI